MEIPLKTLICLYFNGHVSDNLGNHLDKQEKGKGINEKLARIGYNAGNLGLLMKNKGRKELMIRSIGICQIKG